MHTLLKTQTQQLKIEHKGRQENYQPIMLLIWTQGTLKLTQHIKAHKTYKQQ